MIEISKKEYNNLMAILYYSKKELEQEKRKRQEIELLLNECIKQNIELKKIRTEVIKLLNKKGDRL